VIRSLNTAASGLEAQQANIERISNDLANVNTDAYKRSRNEFQDLMYETVKEPGGSLGAGSQSPVGVQVGMGVKVGATHKIFEQGPARMTYHPYDFLIEGKGFFPVQMPSGETAYTRNGAFKIDAQGRLQLSGGSQLIPQITIPTNAVNVTVTPSGEVKAVLPNEGEAILGQIQLITFQNEEGLSAMGNSLYKATLASGAPVQSLPGENGVGLLQQGALEGSNVNVANSMVEMISTQRGYEMGTKVMNVVDQMWGSTVNIKN
jgi:flagellar basal-body rod protein FlgG